MSKPIESFQRYLTLPSCSSKWGIQATDLGYTRIPPEHAYPPFKHPESYTLNQKKGRVLDEYQVVYITHGKGIFWSERSGERPIDSGHLFLLFPGVRHRYRPDPATGWVENWIGFQGPYADDIVTSHFSQKDPVIHIGLHPDIQLLFNESCEFARYEAVGFRERIGLKILEILVNLRLHIDRVDSPASAHELQIQKACTQMVESIQIPFDTSAFAKVNGLSHTSFRRHFKTQTGMSPIQYLLDLRIRKAVSLLTQTTLPIREIAEECGFENPLYFSRFFKQKIGHSPSKSRNLSRQSYA